MKKLVLVLLFILFSQSAFALGVAVVPDHLVFEDEAKSFKIINPNKESIMFDAKGESIDCQPAEGELGAQEIITITCTTSEDTPLESLILIETKQKNGDSVGVLPAVAVKAQIVRDGRSVEGKNEQKEMINTKASPLKIDDSLQEADAAGRKKAEGEESDSLRAAEDGSELVRQWTAAIMNDMRAEMITIAVLTIAILYVLLYSWVKERKESISHAETNKDPRQDQCLNIHQGSCPPLFESPAGTSMHSQKNMSGSFGSPQNSPRRQERASQ